MAKQVALVPVRVLDCNGSGTWSGVLAGVDWITRNHVKPAVANRSLGGGFSQSLNDAVTRWVDAGVTYVVGAGNESTDACTTSPASTPQALTVGATTSSDARASFSNYGSCLDLFAPGASVRSAWHTSNTATSTLSGTSTASPHVAGAAALLLERAATALTPDLVAATLLSEATVGVVGSAAGSPNLLLHTQPPASATEPVTTEPVATEPEPAPTPTKPKGGGKTKR